MSMPVLALDGEQQAYYRTYSPPKTARDEGWEYMGVQNARTCRGVHVSTSDSAVLVWRAALALPDFLKPPVDSLNMRRKGTRQ